jgi:hypothetical protein
MKTQHDCHTNPHYEKPRMRKLFEFRKIKLIKSSHVLVRRFFEGGDESYSNTNKILVPKAENLITIKSFLCLPYMGCGTKQLQ